MSGSMMWALLLLLGLLGPGMALKILVVVSAPSRSHFNLGKAVADILHERGHEITMVSAYSSDKKQYKEIAIVELLQDKEKHAGPNFDMSKESKVMIIFKMNEIFPRMTAGILNNKEVQEMLNDKKQKFDLVVIEYFMNEALLGLGVKYSCPVVLISPVFMMNWLATLTGNPIDPATIPNVFLPFTAHMSLMQRVTNTAMNIVQEVLGRWLLLPTQEVLYKKYFPEEAAKVPMGELRNKVAAVLINSHPSMGIARPMLPNSVEIGGYHMENTVKPLPEDLQKILDSAQHGVVYFSMGSILKSSQMPLEVRRGILAALSKFKQTVLWKFEEDLPGKPDNVIIRKWMPQASILAHPNVKVFISHGGLLSVTEAAHHGVPLLAIPIFGDQNHNALAVAERGHGLVVEYSNLTEASLAWGLREMLSDPRYSEGARKVFRLYHDRAVGPRELVAFHCEHAVRSGGAAHLAPPRLSRCSELLLDVAAVLLLPLLLLLLLLALALRACIGACAKAPGDKPKQKKN